LERRLSEISKDGLGERRKRLLFRCRHRGIREMDFVLGRFADAHLAALTEVELVELEHWLEIPDQQMFAFINGTEPPPAHVDTPFFKRLLAFHGRNP
jgi:antitoxin CptB